MASQTNKNKFKMVKDSKEIDTPGPFRQDQQQNFDVNKAIAQVQAIKQNMEKEKNKRYGGRFGNKAEERNIAAGGKNVM